MNKYLILKTHLLFLTLVKFNFFIFLFNIYIYIYTFYIIDCDGQITTKELSNVLGILGEHPTGK